MRTQPLVSLADLRSAGISLRSAEAVTIVRELALQVARGELPGVPSAHVVRLSGEGALTVEGPVAADENGVSRIAQLLEALLPGFDAPPELRSPGALRLVVARALGTLDLPPYASLEGVIDALARFATPDPQATVRDLAVGALAAGAAAVVTTQAEEGPDSQARPEPSAPQPFTRTRAASVTSSQAEGDAAPLTISDIRRARRATGVSLAEIAELTGISAVLLRELEWGDLRNWPTGPLGRTQLVRYARAAGLDDELVVKIAWPLLEEWAGRDASLAPVTAVVAPEPLADIPAQTAEEHGTAVIPYVPRRTGTRRWIRRGALAALAIPALLAVGVAPALWGRAVTQSTAPVSGASAPVDRGAAPRPAPVSAAAAPAAPPAVVADETTSAAALAPVPPSTTSVPTVAAPHTEDSPASAAASTDARAVTASAFDTTLADAVPARGVPGASVYSPSFANVGTAMFYHAESNGQSALMRADTDSRGAILRITSVVDDSARNFHARPSPDGTRIAFDSDRDGERAVYIADADGKQVRRVSGDGFAAIPSWSPDGATLAFVRAEPGRPKVWNLWTMDVASGQTRRLTSYRFGQPWGGSWFPDGRRMAYSHEQSLVVLDTVTGRQQTYTSPIKGRLLRTPAVSPDGKRVMFQVYRDGAWLLDLPSGAMRKILADPSAEEYTWAPDGRRVAYHSRRSGGWGVWVMASR